MCLFVCPSNSFYHPVFLFFVLVPNLVSSFTWHCVWLSVCISVHLCICMSLSLSDFKNPHLCIIVCMCLSVSLSLLPTHTSHITVCVHVHVFVCLYVFVCVQTSCNIAWVCLILSLFPTRNTLCSYTTVCVTMCMSVCTCVSKPQLSGISGLLPAFWLRLWVSSRTPSEEKQMEN